ncbi:SURF1 family protein [Sphingomonas sp. BN140010]|uniref:SURF1-like protein n=1 Tax=Sphingomonas arvum TaxID=2992113 RepID=A0ABT3JBA6_9SPHN|nr:SURF1 family protein [Sphingomonas sp. BN140010]MCW3796340.1 SURF1 family protein [Sphingomonas sp. BN140010]
MSDAGTGRGKRWLLLALCLLGLVLFTGLGTWQVERRAWKLDLIARVNQRVHAPPVPLGPAPTWSGWSNPREAEYRHVSVTGTFAHDRTTLVDALTELGAGYWVLTPMRTADSTVLINRGFLPRDQKGRADRPTGPVTVTGLLRLSEPNGRFLRPNKPAQDLWYSRDVAAIARRRGLGPVLPFFVDADATRNPGGWPRGGLTVIQFRNTHLLYALTWFGLAALSLVGLVLLLRPAHKRG